MNQRYKTIETSKEVWDAILNTYKMPQYNQLQNRLVLLCSIPLEDGGRRTSLGFLNATIPLMEKVSVWSEEKKRMNHKYYLCYCTED